ncbi:MAG: DNA-directed RNA polymerase subunit RpoH/Rpb5 C-terminal domain-containing protein [Candidatus Micrarchaeota archaeon]
MKAINCKVGDVVRIIRKETVGTNEYYRLVIK